jgi:hypothetical protein
VLPKRLFRVETPFDVWAAALVADLLPGGRDVLVVSSDHVRANRDEYVECLRQMARLHAWSGFVDVSGLPMNVEQDQAPPALARLAMVRQRMASARALRERLSSAIGVDKAQEDGSLGPSHAFDEVYFSCIAHPDHQLLYRLFPDASKNLLPHNPDNLSKHELTYYGRFFGSGSKQPIAARALDALKRVVWGLDAVPPRSFPLDSAFFFRCPAPWATRNVSLSSGRTLDTFGRTFDRLGEAVRSYYRQLALEAGPRACLLALSAEATAPNETLRVQLDAYRALVEHMIAADGANVVVIKPHPTSAKEWVGSVVSALAGVAAQLKVVDRYGHYPTELVMHPFKLLAAGVLFSTSVWSLNQIYGVRCYCPEDAIRALWSNTPLRRQVIGEWIEEYRPFYTPIT